MAAKNTPQIIPLCHPLLLSGITCELRCDAENGSIHVQTLVRCEGKTGVEMEALCAATAALLCVYDMTKGVDDTLEIRAVRLLEKSGGQSGHWTPPARSAKENLQP